MYLNFAAGTLSDLSVAIALCVLLFRARTGFRKYTNSIIQTGCIDSNTIILTRTDSLIKSLVAYTVNTGLIVA